MVFESLVLSTVSSHYSLLHKGEGAAGGGGDDVLVVV